MNEWTLPKGWAWVPLGTVASDTERKDPRTESEKTFRYVEISSVDNDKSEIKLNQVRAIQGHNAPSRARKVIKADDVILATTRPYLKNIALVPDALDSEICSTGFCVIRAKSDAAIPKYLFFACRSDLFINQLIPKQRGASYPAVTDGDIYKSLIPIPYPDDPVRSLATQRRIVARIEALFAELREARRLHEEVVADTGRLMEAVLAEVFPPLDQPTPEGWNVYRIKDIAAKPQYGYTQSANTAPVGPKFLRITDIQDGKVNWDIVPYCECDAKALEKYRLRPGDIVFARSGATTGKTYLVKDPPEAVFASYLIRLRIIRQATPEYVQWFFQSPYYWRQIVPRGGAQPNMNARVLQEVMVPVPEAISLQQNIVARLEAIRAEIDEMQKTQAEEAALLDEMEQAILAQAFRGEL